MLNSRISSFLGNKSFLVRKQARFRKCLRITIQMIILKTVIDKYIQKRRKYNKLCPCFIDLKKAFNTVWHNDLLSRLGSKVQPSQILSVAYRYGK